MDTVDEIEADIICQFAAFWARDRDELLIVLRGLHFFFENKFRNVMLFLSNPGKMFVSFFTPRAIAANVLVKG